MQNLLRVLSVDGQEFIPHQEREFRCGQRRGGYRIDQEFAIVDIDTEVEPRHEVRRHAVHVMRIVQIGDVGDHDLVKIQVIPGGAYLVEPWGDVQKIDAKFQLPVIGSVIFVVDSRNIQEVGDLFIYGELSESSARRKGQRCPSTKLAHVRSLLVNVNRYYNDKRAYLALPHRHHLSLT